MDQGRQQNRRMLYAGNNLEKAKNIFAEAVKHRPRIKLTIRQRTRVLQQVADPDGLLQTAIRQVADPANAVGSCGRELWLQGGIFVYCRRRIARGHSRSASYARDEATDGTLRRYFAERPVTNT